MYQRCLKYYVIGNNNELEDTHQVLDLLENMLSYTSNNRITAQQALSHKWFQDDEIMIPMPKFKQENHGLLPQRRPVTKKTTARPIRDEEYKYG
jgi:hypothetical protein